MIGIDPQFIQQMFEAYKSGQTPEQFFSSASQSTSMQGGSIPEGLRNRLYNAPSEGGYDYQQFGAAQPPPMDPSITKNYTQAMGAAAQPYQPGTLDKIAAIGGLGATLLGAAGVGNRNTRNVLGLLGGMGMGYPAVAEQKDTEQKQRGMMAAQGQYEAGLNDYKLGYGRWQDQQDVAGNVVNAALNTANFDQRQAAKVGTGSGGSPKFKTYEQMAVYALETGQIPATIKNIYPDKTDAEIYDILLQDLRLIKLRSMNLGGMNIPSALLGQDNANLGDLLTLGTVPSTTDVNRAEKDFQGLKDEQLRRVREGVMNAMGAADNPDKWDQYTMGWPLGRGGKAIPPNTPEALGAIRDSATVGGWRKGLGWWGPDPYTNTDITNPLDSLDALNQMSLQGFIDQSGGKYTDQTEPQVTARENILSQAGLLKPPPNDGSLTADEYERFKQLWKTDPETRRRWKEANK